ncbi:MAG TPA: type II secretion system protein [Candidatus Andersenbacteria bacterium]|nr:type II secretion system protein [Candidatus Andersenbacteria bacterium]
MRPKPSGFTLVELMVVVAISSIILVILMRTLATAYPLSRTIWQQASATETARVHLKRITKALRELRESDAGGYPLVVADSHRLIFYSDLDSDAVTERLRYELSGTTLQRGVLEPSGDPLTYDVANEVVSDVAVGIRNGAEPIFVYYSGEYPADPAPLTPSDLTDIKYIQFRLLVDADVGNDPAAVELVSQVQLRNLKTNLGGEL